ncbi:MAG: hypothetical protein B6D61_00620 [Bacteroidetes bacterium 4484_249]|nr:MAG: hypothetical protein B6D61_00620 [Bacteroidetes bacterium 4484_249]
MKLNAIIRSIILFGIIVFFAECKSALSQEDEATWWNKAHNWDGITHWSDYIIFSPYYLGPNALSVPFSQKGLVKNRYELQINAEGYFSEGDKTQSLFMSLYVPVVKNLVAVEFYGVPFEHYKMDEKTVYERRTRNRSGEGYAVGDFYFSTIIQLLKNNKFPDIAFRMACRTASGSKLSDARFTDAPGYFFDLSFGKDLLFQEKFINKIRFHGTVGFYSWQMNLPDNRQNDALIYGLGADLFIKKFIISNSIDGYYGYIGNEEIIVVKKDEPVPYKDRPMVYRLDITKESKLLDIIIGYQLGLYDFAYQTIKFSLLFHIDKI